MIVGLEPVSRRGLLRSAAVVNTMLVSGTSKVEYLHKRCNLAWCKMRKGTRTRLSNRRMDHYCRSVCLSICVSCAAVLRYSIVVVTGCEGKERPQRIRVSCRYGCLARKEITHDQLGHVPPREARKLSRVLVLIRGL